MRIENRDKISLVMGDITEIEVDAIVNAANNTLLGGGGVDFAIHSKGGRNILEQCKRYGGCPTGEARITTAGNLPCKYVIHTVGPIYGENYGNDGSLLYSSYNNSLKLAVDYQLKSIAFPSISTGAYKYPIAEAVKVAFKAVMDFLDKDEQIEKVVFVLYSVENYSIYKDYLSSF